MSPQPTVLDVENLRAFLLPRLVRLSDAHQEDEEGLALRALEAVVRKVSAELTYLLRTQPRANGALSTLEARLWNQLCDISFDWVTYEGFDHARWGRVPDDAAGTGQA